MINEKLTSFPMDSLMQINWIQTFISSGITTSILGLIIYFIKTKWEIHLRNKLDQRIESLKSDLRREEELIKARFASAESDMAAIRSSIFSELSNRRSAADQRKFQAIERIWIVTIDLNKLLMLARFMEKINIKFALETVTKSGPDKTGTQEFAKMLLNIVKIDNDYISKLGCEQERLYVPTEVWSVFSIYQNLLFLLYAKAKAIELGSPDFLKNENIDDINKSLKIILPHMANYIDEYKDDAHVYLVSQVRDKLFDVLKKAIYGDAINDSSLDDLKILASSLRMPQETQNIDIPDIPGLSKNSQEKNKIDMF